MPYLHWSLTRGGRSGEPELSDLRVGRQRGARLLSVPGHHVQHSRGQLVLHGGSNIIIIILLGAAWARPGIWRHAHRPAVCFPCPCSQTRIPIVYSLTHADLNELHEHHDRSRGLLSCNNNKAAANVNITILADAARPSDVNSQSYFVGIGQRTRLQYNAVAGSQGRCNLPSGHEKGKVPVPKKSEERERKWVGRS